MLPLLFLIHQLRRSRSLWSAGEGALPSVARADITSVCSSIASWACVCIINQPWLCTGPFSLGCQLSSTSLQKGPAKALGLAWREVWIYIKITSDGVFVNSSQEKLCSARYVTSQREKKQPQKTTPFSHKHPPWVKLNSKSQKTRLRFPLRLDLPRGC